MDDYSTIKAVNLILLETISKQITLEAQEEDRYIIKKGKRKLRNIIPKIAGMSFKEKKVNVTQIPYSQVFQRLRKMSGKSLEDKLDGTIIPIIDQTLSPSGRKYDIQIQSSKSQYGESLTLTAIPA